MSFFESFPEDQKQQFRSAADKVKLKAGDYLMRRGDPGGDVFQLSTGSLEVVDTRSSPEVVFAVLDAGAVVGEMSFVDNSPRSADVRAATNCNILRWTRDDLSALLHRNPELAASFYAAVAKLASERIRNLSEGAVRGVFRKEGQLTDDAEFRQQLEAIMERPKRELPELENSLRADGNNAEAIAHLRGLLDALQDAIDQFFHANRGTDPAQQAAETLARELHPYLVRSSLADRSIRRSQGVSGTAEILAHVLVDTAGGDGRFGELLDRWLLDRPTFRSLRAVRQPLVDGVRRHITDHRNRRLLLVNAGTGSLVAKLAEVLSHPPTTLTVIDQSRDALSFLDAGMVARPKGIEVTTMQANLPRLAMGQVPADLPKQDAIVLHGLLEYLPERLAVSLLTTAAGLLTQDGIIAATALLPSEDATLLDRLIRWPTIRRTPDAVHALFRAARLSISEAVSVPKPGMLLIAARNEATVIRETPLELD